MEDIAIKLDAVSFSYEGIGGVLSNISLEVKRGEVMAIIGANGSGKTTLLNILDSLIFPSSGRYLFFGEEMREDLFKDAAAARSFRRRVGYLFQDVDVFLFSPTVFDELAYAPLHLGLERGEIEERVWSVADLLGIRDLMRRSPDTLSMGEKKKVAMGAVLTANPEVLLLDEPTAGLDGRSEAFFVELILSLNKGGKTLVIATHDLSIPLELDSKVALLGDDHSLLAVGPASRIVEDRELLLRANLIHEHGHIHRGEIHRHLHAHFGMHVHKDD